MDSKTPSSRYQVVWVPIEVIKPSPENDELYGTVDQDDETMESLIASIERLGLEEPLILTRDLYLLSGHRRYYALLLMGWTHVPCRIRKGTVREGNPQFHRELADYNPQRLKSVGALLREAMLRDESPADTHDAIRAHQEASLEVDAEFMVVPREKAVKPIGDKKTEFLEAVKHVVKQLRPYWPLSIRQIHYNLLNDPPLTLTPKRSKHPREYYRYRNNASCYKALVRLLIPARYLGHIPMLCIDDPTRPRFECGGYDSVNAFVKTQIRTFLTGYHRRRQLGQPRHIELLGEKNTLKTILEPVAKQYYVPLSLGRGFCSVPVWKKMAENFRRSEKDAMTLIIVSDYDPDGLELADDAIRSLRDLWDIPVDGHRIAVTREQIDELGIASDFNPAKTESTRYKSFVERTGGKQSWECEALPPEYLIEQVKAAIESNMDMKVFKKLTEDERKDRGELRTIKKQIAGNLQF